MWMYYLALSLSASRIGVDRVQCRSRWICCSLRPGRCWLDGWCSIWIRRPGYQRRLKTSLRCVRERRGCAKMRGIKNCIIWTVRYIGLSRDLSLKEGTLRGEMEAGERFVCRREYSVNFTCSLTPPAVDIRGQVQRRQGRTQSQVQKRILGDGELGQEHELVPVLCRSRRRCDAISQTRREIRALWSAQGRMGGVGRSRQRRRRPRWKTDSARLGWGLRALVRGRVIKKRR